MESSAQTSRVAAVEAAGLSTAQALAIARKHLLLVLACWIAVFTATVFWSLGQVKQYRAEAMLRLDPDPPRPLGGKVEYVQRGSGAYWNHREFFETEFHVIRSLRVAGSVVRTLGLQADPGFLGVKPKDRGRFKPIPVEDAARALIGRLSVEGVKDSSLAYVRYEDSDPKRAEMVLNTVVRTYLAQNLQDASSVSTSAVEWLNGQLDHLKVELENSEVALNDFRQKNNVLSVSLEDSHNILSAELDQLSKDIGNLQTQRAALAAHAAELDAVKTDDPLQAAASELLQSGVLSGLRSDYANEELALETLRATLDENHPKVLGEKAAMTATAKSIRTEVWNIRGAAAKAVAEVDKQLTTLRTREADLKKQAHELQSYEITFNQLNRTKVNNEHLYSMVLERTRETDLTRMMNFNNVRVVDDATEPKAPVRPNVPMNVAAGAAAGLFLGILAALAREWSDRSIKTPADVEAHLGVPCIGLLPEISSSTRPRYGRSSRRRSPTRAEVAGLQDRDLVVAAAPLGGVAEATRVIRTNLAFMSPDRPYKRILVSSAVPEEGKTTVACSIATVLAQSGLRVLIVDTDLRRPRLHRTFSQPNDVGVTLAVTGQASLDECIRETAVENLWVLTSGPVPPNPAEMLQSDAFKRLAEQLHERFDRVIYDSPPILPVTDAAILGKLTDGIVVVARAFRTDRSAVRQGIRHLLDVKDHVIGVVLNDVDFGRGEYGKYSGYHYYYRRKPYYAADEQPLHADGPEAPPPPAASTEH